MDFQWESSDVGTYVAKEVMIGLFGVQWVGLVDRVNCGLVVECHVDTTGRYSILVGWLPSLPTHSIGAAFNLLTVK